MAERFATQFITSSLLCINTAVNHTGQYHSQYLSIADQNCMTDCFIASHCETIVLSVQSRLFQHHEQNLKAHNRKCNTFLSILVLTLSADINPNPGQEASLEQHSYDTSESLPTYYPCGCCTREVSWWDREVNCDECYSWYIDCHKISTVTYNDLGDDDSTGHTGQRLDAHC